MNFNDVKMLFTNLTWQASIVLVIIMVLIFLYIYARYNTYKNWRNYLTGIPKSMIDSCPDQWTRKDNNVCVNTYNIGQYSDGDPPREIPLGMEDGTTHREQCDKFRDGHHIPWEKCDHIDEIEPNS